MFQLSGFYCRPISPGSLEFEVKACPNVGMYLPQVADV